MHRKFRAGRDRDADDLNELILELQFEAGTGMSVLFVCRHGWFCRMAIG